MAREGSIRRSALSANRGRWLDLSCCDSKLRHGLQLPNYPTIGARCHEDDKVHDDMLIVDNLSAIGDLQLILSGIVQLHDIAFRGIEHRFQPVILIYMPLAEAGVLLCVYSLKQLLFCVSRKRPLQRIRGIELESLSHTRPCETIVAKDPLLGQAFDLPGAGIPQIDLHFNRGVGGKRMESRTNH